MRVTVRVKMTQKGSKAPDRKVRCPHCQTTRLRVFTNLDRIEKLYGNSLLNRMRARRGYTIYFCVYCRLQFYSRHRPGELPAGAATTDPV